MAARVLLALDDDGDAFAAALRAVGWALESCPSERVVEAARSGACAACVLELGEGGLPPELVRLAEQEDGPALIALAVPRALALAPQALAGGADAVLPRGAESAWLVAAVRAALERRASACELARRRADRERLDALLLGGPSAAARRLREGLDRIAGTPRTTVLVSGPVGTVAAAARLVHFLSARARGTLVEVACGVEPDASEARALDAAAGRGTWLGRAEGGTLILREVGRLGPLGQEALARALEADDPEGAGADVRLVATTTLDLADEVERGRFREDLLYRLNVLSLRVPALADRREDLHRLAEGLLEVAAQELARPQLRFEQAALEALAARDWPGDLDELRAAIRLAAAGASGPTVRAADLGTEPAPPFPRSQRGTAESPPSGASPQRGDRTLRTAEEALIREVLKETGGNKLRAAELLGIHRTTLYGKLRAYGMLDPDAAGAGPV